MKKKQEKINDALLKVALGCKVAEVTEEYAEVDGQLKLTKRKETKKDIPPDLKAVQLLLAEDAGDSDYALMSDEQLQAEKNRLIELLAAQGRLRDEKKPTKEKLGEKTSGAPEKKMVKKRKMKRTGTR